MTAEEKYSRAVELYRSTDMSVSKISKECGLSRSAFAAYIQRNHRDLMYARHGIAPKAGNSDHRMKPKKGQSSETRMKYREAILACDSEEYIDLNVSQIAQMFDVSPVGLANQLRMHYPEIISRREKARGRVGLGDNRKRGVRRKTIELYAPAIELLRNSNLTIKEVAKQCDVSFTGLRQHVQFYHKDIVEKRERNRESGKITPVIGSIAGNGKIRRPSEELQKHYAESVELYRTSSLTVAQIAERTGVDPQRFQHYMWMWQRKLILERNGVDPEQVVSDREAVTNYRRSSKATREKYREMVEMLRTTDKSTEAVAKLFNTSPEALRSYLRNNEADLYNERGKVTLPNGRIVLRRAYEKYSGAIELCRTTSGSLKSIANKLGLNYNPFLTFMRRNFPELCDSRKGRAPAEDNMTENEV